MTPEAPTDLPQVQGYDQSNLGASLLQAPSVRRGDVDVIVASEGSETRYSEEELRSAVMGVVSDHCCWGKKVAQTMTIGSVKPVNSYHCKLETYVEKRTTSWTKRPHNGEQPDGHENGIPPQPWDIVVRNPSVFHEQTIDVVVPHTESVRQCTECFGVGSIRCLECNAAGWSECSMCSGRGKVSHFDGNENKWENCSSCSGTGRNRCSKCDGKGNTECSDCKGRGRVVHYINLKVEFINHIVHDVLDISGLPQSLIQGAEGIKIVEQQGYRLLPPVNIDPELIQSCSKLVGKGDEIINAGTSRLLQQRFTIRVIPVTSAVGTTPKHSFDFWVYGTNKVCHLPKYPTTACWGCTAM